MERKGAIDLVGPIAQRNTEADRVALAAVFSALRTPARVRVLQVLMQHGPISSVELRGATGQQYLAHAEDLLAVGLASRRMQRGHWVWNASPDALDRVTALLRTGGSD